MELKSYKIPVLIIFGVLCIPFSARGNGNAEAPQVDVAQVVKSEVSKLVGYDKGFFVKTADDKFKLKLNIQLQPQYQYLSIESRQHTPDPRDNINSFQMRRARFTFSGNVFEKELTYKFQFEAASGRPSVSGERVAGGGVVAHTGPNLREAWVNYKIYDALELMAGQFKGDFNREELTSSSQLQFVDRSINNEVFTVGYDLGAMIHGRFGSGYKFKYSFYVQNEGNNRNSFNVDNELLMGARLIYNILGNHGYTQSDLTDSEDPQLSVGLAGYYNTAGRGVEDNLLALSSDIAIKYRRFSFVGEFNYGRNTTDGLYLFGFLGQAGYFIIPETLEVAARVSGVVPTAANVTNGYEFGGALNYFFYGHNVKIQMDYSMLKNSALAYNGNNQATNFVTAGNLPSFTAGQTDHRLRSQIQLFF